MTKQEFDTLKVGDEIELLDLKLQRSGNIFKIQKKRKNSILFQQPNHKTLTNLSNEIRISFPEKNS